MNEGNKCFEAKFCPGIIRTQTSKCIEENSVNKSTFMATVRE